MNLITKLLIENQATIYNVNTDVLRQYNPINDEIVIFIPNSISKVASKKDLLDKVQEPFYVSALEWELLNYWKDIGIDEIYKYQNNDDIFLCGLGDQYLQPSSVHQIFRFMKYGEHHKLDALIQRCALIEG